jgi:hypothetical protein
LSKLSAEDKYFAGVLLHSAEESELVTSPTNTEIHVHLADFD